MKRDHDEIASQIRKVNHAKSWFKKSADIIDSIDLPTKSCVLDIGAGKGEFLELLRDKDNTLELWGCDYTETNLRELEAREMKTLNIDLDSFALKDYRHLEGKFNVITMLEVIEHIFDLDRLFQLINLLLKEDGYLIISTPNTESFAFKLYYILRGFPYAEGHHVRFLTPKKMRQHLFFAGFDVIRYENYFSWGTNIICRGFGIHNKYLIGILTVIMFSPFYLFSKLNLFTSLSNQHLVVLAQKKTDMALGFELHNFKQKLEELSKSQQRVWVKRIRCYVKKDKLREHVHLRAYIHELLK